jgi:hypothetical protein
MTTRRPTYRFDTEGHTVVEGDSAKGKEQDTDFPWILLMFLIDIVLMAIPTVYMVYLIYTGQYHP